MGHEVKNRGAGTGRRRREVSPAYEKYVYWLDGPEEAQLRAECQARGVKVRSAKGIVCTPLDEINRITAVAPSVWDETCGRAGSWYRASDKNGLYLVVSAFELDAWSHRRTARITRSAFKPPRRATEAEQVRLGEQAAFARMVPPQWNAAGETEKRVYLRWARRLGSPIKDFDTLFRIHTANHANFVRPLLYTRDGNEVVPYSIERSAHLCSCCLELFQILGTRYPRKLVAPCPGAVIFARLSADRYLLVEGSAPAGGGPA